MRPPEYNCRSDKPDWDGTSNSVPYPAIEDKGKKKKKRIIGLISRHRVYHLIGISYSRDHEKNGFDLVVMLSIDGQINH